MLTFPVPWFSGEFPEDFKMEIVVTRRAKKNKQFKMDKSHLPAF